MIWRNSEMFDFWSAFSKWPSTATCEKCFQNCTAIYFFKHMKRAIHENDIERAVWSTVPAVGNFAFYLEVLLFGGSNEIKYSGLGNIDTDHAMSVPRNEKGVSSLAATDV